MANGYILDVRTWVHLTVCTSKFTRGSLNLTISYIPRESFGCTWLEDAAVSFQDLGHCLHGPKECPKSKHSWLVVSTPLKNISQLGGLLITPNIWKNKKCPKPPTSYVCHVCLTTDFWQLIDVPLQPKVGWNSENRLRVAQNHLVWPFFLIAIWAPWTHKKRKLGKWSVEILWMIYGLNA